MLIVADMHSLSSRAPHLLQRKQKIVPCFLFTRFFSFCTYCTTRVLYQVPLSYTERTLVAQSVTVLVPDATSVRFYCASIC